MAQLSRPFQIFLVALALFVLAWFVVLHRPGSGSSGNSASSSVAHPHVPPNARHGTVRATVHGTGDTTVHATVRTTVHGTGGATAHATVHGTGTTVHGAGTAVQRTGATTPHATVRTTVHATVRTGTHASHASSSPAVSGAAPHAAVDPRGAQPVQRDPAAAAKSPAANSMQATVAAELKQGKVVLLLFWTPGSSSDRAVHQQVQIVARKFGRGVAVHTASAEQVGSFGSITRDIQVYQTPTLLIVNPHGQVTTVTGYTDAYALEQTIREARG
jgi:hypothetical protein